MLKVYERWLRICTDSACIGVAVLAVWAIPLLHESGPLALLPYAGLAGMLWTAVTAAGLAVLWRRYEWPSSRVRQQLAGLSPLRLVWREREA